MGQEEYTSISPTIKNNNAKINKKFNYVEYFSNNNILKPTRAMFEFLYVIGRGGFGKVWMVKYKETHEKYALKEMSKVKIIDRKSEKSIKNEREFLSQLHHPFIVNMKCSFQDYDNLYLVMDLLTGGDLRYHICQKKQFNEEQSRFFSSCILLGLEYIHMNNIIHRDIKPENLVLDEKGYVRITDFGVAKKNARDNSSETSGTPGYMAPEVLCGLNHSFSVDFFALGVIMYEFMNGYRPYMGRNRNEIKEAILSRQARIHRKQLFENGYTFESGDLINKLLHRKPDKRLGLNGIKEIKEHSWFKNINWEELHNKKMKSPFIPTNGDNFDKRYCEGIEHIDTKTEERYLYYKSKSKFKTLFINYTFVREEDKQEYINKYYKKINKSNNSNNALSPSKSSLSNINSKYSNNIESNHYENGSGLSRKNNSNSMTNIHSFSILNNTNSKMKESKRNKKANNYFNQINNENIDKNIDDVEDENQKLFSRTFKMPSKINNNFFSDNINEMTSNKNDNNLNSELKVFINKKEINQNKKEENFNRLSYFKEKIKDSNQFRSSSTINKRQNDYYLLNNSKNNNKINDNYYDLNSNNYNNKNMASIKININSSINNNKYKYNRSSSQKNIFYDTKGIKKNQGKIVKYINIEEDMEDKSNMKNKDQGNKNIRMNKRELKNSNGIFINPSQYLYYPSHINSNISNNLSISLKKSNSNRYNNNVINSGKNEEYLLYKTSRNFHDKDKKLKSENYQYNVNENDLIENNNNNRMNNNININFNINNISNNINNINQINSDNYNNSNFYHQRKIISKAKGTNNSKAYYINNTQRKYISGNNNNILVIKSLLSSDNNSQYGQYNNNIVIDNNNYKSNIFNNDLQTNIINNNNKNKTLSKASSMKSFGIKNNNFISKNYDKKDKNNINKNIIIGSDNNIYYNFEILSPGNRINNKSIIIENNTKKGYKNNFMQKQKTEKPINSKLISNGWNNQNKYLIFN